MKHKILMLFAMLMFVCSSVMAETVTVVSNSGNQKFGVNFTAASTEFTGKEVPVKFTVDNTATFGTYDSNYLTIYGKQNLTHTIAIEGVDGAIITGFYIKFKTNRSSSSYVISVSDGEQTVENVLNSFKEMTSGESSFTMTGNYSYNMYIYEMTIDYTVDASATTKPELTAAAEFVGSKDVTITNKAEGATVYYTTDGTDPTTSSASFTDASKTLNLTETTTVKAMAVAEGKNPSQIASAKYTRLQEYTLAEVASLAPGTYVVTFTDAVCTGQSSRYAAVEDATGAVYFELSTTAPFSKSQKINGYMKCTVANVGSAANTMKKITNIDASSVYTKENVTELPLTTVTWDELCDNYANYYAKRIKVAGVYVASLTSSSATSGTIQGVGSEKTLNAYFGKFGSGTLPAADDTKNYTMTTIVGYNGVNQVWNPEFKEATYTRATATGRYGTICLEYDAEVEGAVVLEIGGKNLGENGETVKSVTLVYPEGTTEATATVLKAGVPYIYRATADAQTFTYTGDTKGYAQTVNGLIGKFTQYSIPSDGTYYFLYTNASNEQVIARAGSGNTCGANKAYIHMSEVPVYDEAAEARAAVTFAVEGDDATGINAINLSTAKDGKYIENGHIVIVKNGNKYNAVGQQVK